MGTFLALPYVAFCGDNAEPSMLNHLGILVDMIGGFETSDSETYAGTSQSLPLNEWSTVSIAVGMETLRMVVRSRMSSDFPDTHTYSVRVWLQLYLFYFQY